MNVNERRERLIKVLMMNEIIPIRDLAEKLEVSERTILRDISILSLTKPITGLTGKGGGVYITDKKAVDLLYLKENEVELLKKIYFCIGKQPNNFLSESEIQLLKEMIIFYTQPKYEKGKKVPLSERSL